MKSAAGSDRHSRVAPQQITELCVKSFALETVRTSWDWERPNSLEVKRWTYAVGRTTLKCLDFKRWGDSSVKMLCKVCLSDTTIYVGCTVHVAPNLFGSALL